MKPILISLLAGLAGLSAFAKDITYHDLTLTLDPGVTAETNAESGLLFVLWGRPGPDGHWPPLFLMQCPVPQYLPKTNTNVQTQIAQLAGFYAGLQQQIFKGWPTLQRLTAATNEVTLGPWKATEVLVTASYRDRDFGTMSYASWFWEARGKIWQAVLQNGTEQHIAQARTIIGKIKLKPGNPPAATADPPSAGPKNPWRKTEEPREHR
jgi:hypothetical protein